MKIFLGIIVFLTALLLSLMANSNKQPEAPNPTPTTEVSPTAVPATPTPTITPTETPSPTSKRPSPTPTMQIIDLNSTVNAYRVDNGRSVLLSNGDLCRIASTRVAQQAQAGSLDNHAGFQGEAASQKEFLHVGEILESQDPPQSNHYLVYKGWAQSPEHNAILLDPSWTHGCGATSGPFAVFIFAR